MYFTYEAKYIPFLLSNRATVLHSVTYCTLSHDFRLASCAVRRSMQSPI
jgi:hypothetical protein